MTWVTHCSLIFALVNVPLALYADGLIRGSLRLVFLSVHNPLKIPLKDFIFAVGFQHY